MDEIDFTIQISTPDGGTFFWEPPEHVKSYMRKITAPYVPEIQGQMIDALKERLSIYFKIFSINVSTGFHYSPVTEIMLTKVILKLQELTAENLKILRSLDPDDLK